MANFMFATGIENSIPTINNGRTRVDQMEVCGHYRHWRTDFDLVEDLGIRYLRFGPPLHTTFLAPGRYDWGFADLTLGDLKARGITPIVDLVHYGTPGWLEGAFLHPDFPARVAEYAARLAERFRGRIYALKGSSQPGALFVPLRQPKGQRQRRLQSRMQLQHAAPPEFAEQAQPAAPARELPPAGEAGPAAPFVRGERKVGRNEPCPCGSGRKYKHCHGSLG